MQPVSRATVFVVGPGNGDVLKAIAQKSPAATVVALEPDAAAAARLVTRPDWQQWMNADRLRLLIGPEYVGAAECAKLVDGRVPAEVIVQRTLQAGSPETVAQARRVVKSIQDGAAANAEARRKFAGRYLLQTLANVPAIAREGDAAALDGAFTGRPAVIVAAGPSLDRTVNDLVSYQDRVVIIAADTTLRPLLAAGIRPHLVVGLDPAELNAKHLLGARDTSGSWLVGEASLHPNAFIDWSGRTFTFQVSNHEPWPWLSEQGLTRGRLRAWGSVATAALDLALRLGCDPIIFTGHDLAYTDNRPYCDHTVFHEEWRAYLANNPGNIEHYEELMMQGRPLVDVTGINGPVRSTAHLVAFRDWIAEQTTVTTDRRFINGTGAGILSGPRITQQPLAAALEAHAAESFPIREVLAARHAPGAAIELSQPADAVIQRWIDFTADTVTRTQILEAMGTE